MGRYKPNLYFKSDKKNCKGSIKLLKSKDDACWLQEPSELPGIVCTEPQFGIDYIHKFVLENLVNLKH